VASPNLNTNLSTAAGTPGHLAASNIVHALVNLFDSNLGASLTEGSTLVYSGGVFVKGVAAGSQPVLIKYSGAAPLRNTVTTNTAQPVIWCGPDNPAKGAGYGIAGVDFWWATTSTGLGIDVSIVSGTVVTPNPVASFTASPLTGNFPLTVNFVNTSTNATSYLWNFGDNTTSTDPAPVHTYTTAGPFSPSLTATGAAGTQPNTQIRSGYINVTTATGVTITATPGNASATLTWTAYPDATAYKVGRDGVDSFGAGAWEETVTGTTWTALNLINSTLYTVHVTPVIDGVDGPTSTATVTPTSGSGSPTNPITAIGTPVVAEKNDANLTITVAAPTGIAVGDLLVATVGHSTGTAFTPISGWTLAVGATSVGSSGVYVAKMYKFAVSGDIGASYAFNVATGRATAVMEALRYVHATTPVDVTPSTVGDTSSTAGLTVPSITTVTAGCRLESAYVINSATTEDTVLPATWTLIGKATLGTGRRVHDAFKAQTAAGATGTVAWTKTGTAPLPSAALLMAWRPATPTGGGGGGTTPTLQTRAVGIDGGVKVTTLNATSVRLRASTDAAGTTGVIYSSAVTPDANGVSYPRLTGLTAGVRYYYRVGMTVSAVETFDTKAVIGRIRVAPTGATNFAFNFGGCCNASDSASMAAIAGRADHLFFHLGDMWYADGSGTSVANYLSQMGNKVNAPNHESVFATTPCVFAPSDHDGSMNNNGNAGTDATALTNYNAAYRRLLPTPTGVGMPATTGVYYSFTWGRVQFINIDCRSFASAPSATDNSSKTMLGSTQKTWLKNLITASTAGVICIIGDTAWTGAATAGDDAWIGYTTERQELATHFDASGKAICYLSADMHALGADNGSAPNNPSQMVTFASAPLNNNSSQKVSGWSAGIYPSSGSTVVQQYGRVNVTDTGTNISFAYTGYSSDGTARVNMTANWATDPSPAPPSGTQPTISAGQLGAGAAWVMNFEDTFSGTSIDTTKWNVFDDPNYTMNNVHPRAFNVTVAGGNAILTLSDAGTGAMIATNDVDLRGNAYYTLNPGGIVEARISFPGTSGTSQHNWPAWWTSGPAWPSAGEIDIVEGYDSTLSAANYHWGPAGVNNSNNGPHPTGTYVNGFHIYTAHRLRNEIRVYWDGILQRRLFTTSNGTATGTPLDNGNGQALIINVGSGNGSTAYGSASQVLVDYVRGWIPA
jgi:PKD repeat protein